jgi:hypothetical protein
LSEIGEPIWTEEAEKAYRKLLKTVCSRPYIGRDEADSILVLETDWCQVGIG